MPKCCVKNCGTKYENKSQRISLHKLPKNEKLREKWIESLGQENIDFIQKTLFVCSLHFEDQYINRTLNNFRLQDNAIPTLFPMVNKSQSFGSKAKKVDVDNMNNVLNQWETSNSKVSQDKLMILRVDPIPTELDNGNIHNIFNLIHPQPQPGTSTVVMAEDRTVQKLKARCSQQRLKIKRLNEKCRRQSIKLAHFGNIIAELKREMIKNNEFTINRDVCSGPKDFLSYK